MTKVALITGSGGGLGRSHALTLAREGFDIVVNDVADPDGVVAEITDMGVRAIGVRAGVDTPAGAAEIVAAAREEFGRLDVVVNNAGILRDKSFAKMTTEMFDDVLAVHLQGAFHVTHAAWEELRTRGGSVIMTSSGSGLYGNFGQANYSAAKMGLVGLTRTLAIEGERAGVRVNAIAPLARSQMTENLLPEEVLERLAPEWVSPLVAWLARPDCTATGNIYSVAGGRYARVAVVEGPGVTFAEIPSVDDLAAAAASITTIDGASEPRSLSDQVELVPK